jgi:hypothetical protein
MARRIAENYARGVAAMKQLDQSDPSHGANWTNQAAIHERRAAPVSGRLEDQCQHASRNPSAMTLLQRYAWTDASAPRLFR